MDTLRIVSPATGETVADVPLTATAELPEIERRARAAQLEWAERGIAERAAALRRFREAVVDHSPQIAEVVSSETGKPISDGYSVEAFYVLEGITYYAKNAERHLRESSLLPRLLKTKRTYSRYVPRGVAGIISPWNFPFAIPIGDAIPALLAGNAVIVKPSEVTPRSALLGAEIWREAGLPPDILQVVVGRGDLGAALIEHVDTVMFTGSVATGRRIAVRCGELLKPHSLELGGKDPFIVCADADLERAANACTWGALLNSGQACLSVERVYVEAPVYDRFVELLLEKVRAVRQAPPGEPADIGSLTFAPQLEKVEAHVRDALEKGARALTGGARDAARPGLFYPPTVLVDVRHDMACMRDESFGPTIPVMKVADVEEAIRLANDSTYGLGASVFTKDKAKGLAIARRLRAGGVCVNDALVQAFIPDVPMGGMKTSGIGRRHSSDGIRKYCDQQTIVVDRLGLSTELFWYPFSARKLALLKRAERFLYGSRWSLPRTRPLQE